MNEPYYVDDQVSLHLGDCLDVLRETAAAIISATASVLLNRATRPAERPATDPDHEKEPTR